jgi:prevent-host-death family protein
MPEFRLFFFSESLKTLAFRHLTDKTNVDFRLVLHDCSEVRTATVRDLRNHYTSLLSWVSAGEEVIITQRGKPVARLIPEKPAEPEKVNWGNAPEVTRDRSKEITLATQESLDLIHDASGKW